MKLLRTVHAQMRNDAQHFSHPAAAVPARMGGYVLGYVIDPSVNCYPAIVTVLVLAEVREAPGATQLAQLQGQVQHGRA